jgi:hypothetical protein
MKMDQPAVWRRESITIEAPVELKIGATTCHHDRGEVLGGKSFTYLTSLLIAGLVREVGVQKESKFEMPRIHVGPCLGTPELAV